MTTTNTSTEPGWNTLPEGIKQSFPTNHEDEVLRNPDTNGDPTFQSGVFVHYALLRVPRACYN